MAAIRGSVEYHEGSVPFRTLDINQVQQILATMCLAEQGDHRRIVSTFISPCFLASFLPFFPPPRLRTLSLSLYLFPRAHTQNNVLCCNVKRPTLRHHGETKK